MKVYAYDYFTSQKQWELYLKDLIKSRDDALLSAIVCIYDRQTPEEKNTYETIEENGIGFSKVDAEEMGKIAVKIKNGESLTIGELAKSRNKMQKYWKQLMFVSKKHSEERKQQQRKDNTADAKDEHAKDEQLLFKEHIEIMRRCQEKGISCSFGICSECLVTNK